MCAGKGEGYSCIKLYFAMGCEWITWSCEYGSGGFSNHECILMNSYYFPGSVSLHGLKPLPHSYDVPHATSICPTC